jgi:SOS-response transcriptional repressor LexA
MASVLKARVEARLKATGKSARGASVEAGLDPETIRNILRGRSRAPGYEKVQKLAKALNCSVAYLTGRTPRPDDVEETEPAETDFQEIPVISFVEAGKWGAVTDPYPMGKADEFIGVNHRVGARSFALRIKGMSMFPEYQEGDIVVIDPDVSPLPGDCVVARMGDDPEATFKKFRPRGRDKNGNEIIELAPINTDYPTLTIDAENPGQIVGTEVEHRRFRRR